MLFLEKGVRNIVEKLSKLGSKNDFCKIWYLEIFQQWKFFFFNPLCFSAFYFSYRRLTLENLGYSLFNENNIHEVEPGAIRPGWVAKL